jgi:hypothetical protein
MDDVLTTVAGSSDFFRGGRPGPRFILVVVVTSVRGGCMIDLVEDDNNSDDDTMFSLDD